MLSQQPAKLWSRHFILACAITVGSTASFTSLIAALPLYVKSIGGDDVAVGLVVGIPPLASLISKPFIGSAADRWGKKPVIVTGLFFLVIATVLCSQTREVPSLVAVRVLQVTSVGLIWVAAIALALDLAPAARRGEAIGFFSMFGNAAMALSPLFGIWLISVRGIAIDGYTLMFLSSAALGALTLIPALLVYERSRRPHPSGGFAASLKLRNLIAFSAIPAAIATFLASMPQAVISPFLPLYAGGENAALFFFCYAATTLCSRPFAGIATDRLGWRKMSVPAIALCGGAVSVFTISPASGNMIIAGVIYGLGWGILFPCLISCAAEAVPASQRGAAMGTLYAAIDTSSLLGAFALGFVAQSLGYRSVFTIAAGFAALGLVYLLLYSRLATRARAEPIEPVVEPTTNEAPSHPA